MHQNMFLFLVADLGMFTVEESEWSWEGHD